MQGYRLRSTVAHELSRFPWVHYPTTLLLAILVVQEPSHNRTTSGLDANSVSYVLHEASVVQCGKVEDHGNATAALSASPAIVGLRTSVVPSRIDL